MGSWESKSLGDVCEILDSRRRPVTKKDRRVGEYPYYGATGIVDYVDEFIFDEPLVLVGEDGAKWASGEQTAFLVSGRCWVNNHAHVLRPIRTRLLDEWLVYYLVHEDLSPFVSGLTVPKLNQGNLRDIPIPLPPLLEQRRIVAILDEAFEDIVTARANAEQNLRNARVLPSETMRSMLRASALGWIATTIGDQVTLQRGFDITKEQQRKGSVPVVSSGGIRSHHDTSMVRGPGVVMGRKGTLGKVFYLDQDFWPHDTTLWVKDFKGNDPRFVYRFFEVLEVQSLDSGAANPALNRNQVHALRVAWPPLAEQIALAEKIESLSADASQLTSLYAAKLSALDELKKSLLHQAFSGALTDRSADRQVAEVA